MKIKLMLAVMLLSSVAFAQTTTQRPVAATPKPGTSATTMTNEGVVKMMKAGLSEDLIIASIKNAPQKAFDLTPDGLIALKTAGVPERIMLVMSGAEPSPAAVARPVASPSVPTTAAKTEALSPVVPARDFGFYVTVAEKEVLLDPSVITGGKVGTLGTMMTGGIAKARMKAIVKGPKSNVRLSSPTDFIFVVGNGLTHPNELAIVRFKAESGSRVFQVGEMNAFGGKAGILDEDSVPFKSEKINATTFKLVLNGPLPAGEYAFTSAAMMSISTTSVSGKLWDFGVDR